MGCLPLFQQFIKVRTCNAKNVTHLVDLCIRGPDCILPVCQPNTSARCQFDNHYDILISAVHVRGLVIFRVRSECHAIKENRAHEVA